MSSTNFAGKILFFISFAISGLTASARHENVPLSNPANKEILEYHDHRALDFVNKNLNRFAVERLRTYDSLLDSLYEAELSDTLRQIEKNYQFKSAAQKTVIKNHKDQIGELTEKKEQLENKYHGLVRKALISFVLWLTIVLLLLQFRKKKLNSARKRLNDSASQLNILERYSSKTGILIEKLNEVMPSLRKIEEDYGSLMTIINDGAANLKVPGDWKIISANGDIGKRAIETEVMVTAAVLSQAAEPSEEKIATDINIVCEQFLEMAWRGIEKPEGFNCQVTRDLEKKLPTIKIIPEAVGSLLLNVLMNAFQSVKEKQQLGIKGYQPKVAVSTRILPRFLQIRIRDNGIGMNDINLQQSTGEFYSTKPINEGCGLGLYVGQIIINEMHKGEIKIESEEGNSTDVYIKFFIS